MSLVNRSCEVRCAPRVQGSGIKSTNERVIPAHVAMLRGAYVGQRKHQDGSVSRGLRGAGFSAVRTYVQSGLSEPVNEKSASWLWPTCSEFIGIRSNQRSARARSSGQWGTRDNESPASNDIAMLLPRTLVSIPDGCPRKCRRIVQGEIACSSDSRDGPGAWPPRSLSKQQGLC
jgi:hypothetical protein